MSRKPTPAAPAAPTTLRKVRRGVYTRKSTDEGLEKEFDRLDAQRESCEAYIASQRPEGWGLMPDYYDDSGISGGTLERPPLQRLLRDIETDRVDVVVVYKTDRLSRSLMQFAKLVETFDAHGVTFVSVTRSFNTTTSMGRLTLNILLSFGQFEREVIGDRIRDKIAASHRRGMWMGGWAPLGYGIVDRKLVVNAAEAALVRRILTGFAELEWATRLVKVLRAVGVINKRGKRVDKNDLHGLLTNRICLGGAVHKGHRTRAGIPPSSNRKRGTPSMRSVRLARACVATARQPRRHRCCAACCSAATAGRCRRRTRDGGDRNAATT